MPSAAVSDSQSVKGGQLPALSCGYDAGKKIKGRKRHVLTDTNGLLLVLVTALEIKPALHWYFIAAGVMQLGDVAFICLYRAHRPPVPRTYWTARRE